MQTNHGVMSRAAVAGQHLVEASVEHLTDVSYAMRRSVLSGKDII